MPRLGGILGGFFQVKISSRYQVSSIFSFIQQDQIESFARFYQNLYTPNFLIYLRLRVVLPTVSTTVLLARSEASVPPSAVSPTVPDPLLAALPTVQALPSAESPQEWVEPSEA